MRFLDTAKTIVFGDQNNRQDHGFRAGFVPAFAPSLVAAGAIALGAPAGAVVVALAAGGAAGAFAGVVDAAAGLAAGALSGAFGSAVAAVGGGLAFGAAGALAAVGGGAVLVGDAAAVGGGFALGGALLAEKYGYHFKKFFAGAGAGCAAGAALAFSVGAGHLPPEQPKVPVAGPVPSTLEIKPSGGSLCKNFNVAETTDAQERTVYILTVPKGCTVPAAAAAVPR